MIAINLIGSLNIRKISSQNYFQLDSRQLKNLDFDPSYAMGVLIDPENYHILSKWFLELTIRTVILDVIRVQIGNHEAASLSLPTKTHPPRE